MTMGELADYIDEEQQQQLDQAAATIDSSDEDEDEKDDNSNGEDKHIRLKASPSCDILGNCRQPSLRSRVQQCLATGKQKKSPKKHRQFFKPKKSQQPTAASSAPSRQEKTDLQKAQSVPYVFNGTDRSTQQYQHNPRPNSPITMRSINPPKQNSERGGNFPYFRGRTGLFGSNDEAPIHEVRQAQKRPSQEGGDDFYDAQGNPYSTCQLAERLRLRNGHMDPDMPPLFLEECAHLLSLLSAVAFSTLRNDLEQAESPLAEFRPGVPWPHVGKLA